MTEPGETADNGAEASGPWTMFWDMHSGGSQKLEWAFVIIEADHDTACKMFAEAFGRDPENETCNCCGGDYSIDTEASLAQLTAFQRDCPYASTLVGGDAWHAATKEERQEANRVGRYLEPDEALPDGWSTFESTGVRLGYSKPLPFADFLADPHFEDLGRRREVKIIARPGASDA